MQLQSTGVVKICSLRQELVLLGPGKPNCVLFSWDLKTIDFTDPVGSEPACPPPLSTSLLSNYKHPSNEEIYDSLTLMNLVLV